MLPPDHPRRLELNDEVHARPPEALVPPLRLSYLALVAAGPDERQRQWEALAAIARWQGRPLPIQGSSHYGADFDGFRLASERHTEFTRYTIIAPGDGTRPFAEPAAALLPDGWIAGLPGQLMVAAHVVVLRHDDQGPVDHEALSRTLFGGNVLIGSGIAGGAGTALTDFRIGPDGFSRFLLFDRGMSPRQAGRMVQRLLEIESYRMLALLALPIARELAPVLSGFERELATITTAMTAEDKPVDEPALLDRLTRLEAAIDSREADHHYRFSASRAYHDLVLRRIAELREERLPGLQTFEEFMERRLAPAMATCESVSSRLQSLSERVARATQLLSTRVAIARERQNQVVLETMNRRVALQLRLQETVEGLSVAAITYYIVGLIAYLAKGASAFGLPFSADAVVGAMIPVVLLATAFALRRFRRRAIRPPT
ncbi:MAG TPA: DUF3422 domain-containing protein [Beijerinckiaceae bacterium]|jgi:uncharacterized membrane-anchored protein